MDKVLEEIENQVRINFEILNPPQDKTQKFVKSIQTNTSAMLIQKEKMLMQQI